MGQDFLDRQSDFIGISAEKSDPIKIPGSESIKSSQTEGADRFDPDATFQRTKTGSDPRNNYNPDPTLSKHKNVPFTYIDIKVNIIVIYMLFYNV